MSIKREWPPERPKDKPPLEGADLYYTIGFYGFCMTLIWAMLTLFFNDEGWELLGEPIYWFFRFIVCCLVAWFADPPSILKD